MGKELTVICFLWYGDRWEYKTDHAIEYVNKLYHGVERNLTIPHKFICFTNHNYGFFGKFEARKLDFISLKGCLPKLYMYTEEAGLSGQVLALDIDLVITGSLDDIGSYDGPFCVRSKFRARDSHKADGDIIGFNTESEQIKKIRKILSKISKRDLEDLTEGKERYFVREVTDGGDCDRWQTLFPGQIYSYKRHILHRQLGNNPPAKPFPKSARIISCHGRPRPHEINEPWVKEHWI